LKKPLPERMNATSPSNDDAIGAAGQASGQKLRRILLVVDDEDGPRESLRFVFKEDYEVLMADNGSKALALAREHQIDAAVLDIRMPGMSGVDVLNGLKGIDPSIEVIMLTAYETLETARQALRLGACDYLNKPFDISTLRRSVHNAMERHSAAIELRENLRCLGELREDVENQKMRGELERNRGDIYASVIHDINGPLTVISGFVEVINQRISTAQSLEGEKLDMIRDRINRITKQVASCIQISRRYLSFLHGGSGASSYVGVNQVLGDLQEMLQAHPEASKTPLTIRPLDGEVVAEINGTDLLQILQNLSLNACQSSLEPSAVEIHAALLTGPVDLATISGMPGTRFINGDAFDNRAPLVAITVRDAGPGMPPEVLKRIFELHFTTKPVGRGTGLGLSIVRRLVEGARGGIQVQTEPGKGTAFTVYFPARTASSHAFQT
jgi:signal transduction histidine kinase